MIPKKVNWIQSFIHFKTCFIGIGGSDMRGLGVMNPSPLTVVLHRDKYYICARNLENPDWIFKKFEKVIGLQGRLKIVNYPCMN